MRMKNEILPQLQETFEKALNEGKILSLEEVLAGAKDWLLSLGRELSA